MIDFTFYLNAFLKRCLVIVETGFLCNFANLTNASKHNFQKVVHKIRRMRKTSENSKRMLFIEFRKFTPGF